MEVDFVNLGQIAVNSANPRTITDEAFQKLILSILVLPKMLEIRPIVLNAQMVALGGNMRYRALSAIESMSEREIAQRLSSSADFNKKTDFEKNELIKYWGKWKDNPQVPILMAEGMTDAEQREFIVKDNVGFGKWDMDSLANQFDLEELQEWGLEKVDFGNMFSVDDTDYCDTEDSESGVKNIELKWGTKKVGMSVKEEEELTKLLESYVAEYSVSIGFVNYLIENVIDGSSKN